MADSDVYLGGTAIKPEGWDRSGWEAFQYMLYNPNTGEVLTRTPLSWLKITIFYIIYYGFLTAFWVGSMLVFFQTLPTPEEGPRWISDNGLIGKNPGVGLRPRNTDARIDSQMFVLKAGDTSGYMSERQGEGDLNADYAERVNQFFTVYQKKVAQKKGSFPGYKAFVPATTLGPCGTAPYGYVGNTIAPCIFFKLNNIWGWEPKPVECASAFGNGKDEMGADGQPKDDCPPAVLKHLTSKVARDAGVQNIWIDCKGRYAADQETLDGGLSYYPTSRGLDMTYYPYMGPKNDGNDNIGYHPPLVAVKISPIGGRAGQLIHIECRAYYRGVKHSKKFKAGLVQFEVQIQ